MSGRFNRFTLIQVLALLPAVATAWAQAPIIDQVTYYGGLTPGGLALIDGSFFDRTATVRVGGLPAAVFDVVAAWCDQPGCGKLLKIQLPADLAPGPTTLIITWIGISSDPVPITLEAYAPWFVPWRGFEDLRMDRILPTGEFGPWSCSAGGTPRPGEFVRLYATGLGATDPVIPIGAATPAAPLRNTLAKPDIFIGGQPAEVIESILAPGEIAVYRITLKVPATLEAGWRAVTLSIGGKTTELRSLAVGNSLRSAPRVSPESIQALSACGAIVGVPGRQFTGDPKNPPSKLGGVTVNVKDSRGVDRLAPLLFVAPDRVDYIVPSGTANGRAAISVTTEDGTVSNGNLDIQTIAPTVLMANKLPAAVVVRLRDGLQTVEPVAQELASGGYEPLPIDLGPEADRVYLVVFGTGWRFRSGFGGGIVFESLPDLNSVVFVKADYVGAQGEFAGLDQMNVLLPRSLAGRGDVYGYISVDDQRTGFFARLTFK